LERTYKPDQPNFVIGGIRLADLSRAR